MSNMRTNVEVDKRGDITLHVSVLSKANTVIVDKNWSPDRDFQWFSILRKGIFLCRVLYL